MRGRDRIAMGGEIGQPAGRREQHHQSARQRLKIAHQCHARGIIGQPAPGQHAGETRRHEHGFERDHQPRRHGRARDQRAARRMIPQDRPKRDSDGHNLPAVVIDPQRLELRGQQRHQREACTSEQGRPEAEALAGQLADGEHRHQQQQQRHREGGGPLGIGHRHELREQPHQPRQRRIDQPRPVHQRALGRAHAVLKQVEPALPGEQVAHLHQPHHVVGIGKAPRRQMRRGDAKHRADRQPDQRNREALTPRQPCHHGRALGLNTICARRI